jgi:hypothetical protein
MRGQAHGFHPAGHHDLVVPGAKELIGQDDGVDPGQADLVDVIAGTDIGMPAPAAAIRAGFCPAPAVTTCPMIT